MHSCPHCHLKSDKKLGSHIRWCVSNPEGVAARAHVRATGSNQFTKARDLGLPIPKGTATGKPGFFTGKRHSEEAKDRIREGALASPHRRLVRSIVEYVKIDGSIIKLDSSWEVALAKRLDDLEVEWARPDPLIWVDYAGRSRHYFPDFFLPKYNLFLDPKGPGAKMAQEAKIKAINEQHPNVLFLYTLVECREFDLTNFSPSFNG